MQASRVWAALFIGAALFVVGCQALVDSSDRDVAAAVRERQERTLDYRLPVPPPDRGKPIPTPERGAYQYAPNKSTTDVPPDFRTSSQPTSAPTSQPSTDRSMDVLTYHADGAVTSAPATTTSGPTSGLLDMPLTRSHQKLTLNDALAYAMQHRREYMTAKEDLYISALNLTLERHLWTPQFAADYRVIYGNFGENQNFAQAMRFVQDLSMTQRLPYGGEFTAQVLSTLVRDVKQTITASEGSVANIGLNIPLLRGAGHVADEQLTQLERELTYSVRTFERFRRAQLADVATAYFGLLSSKQAVIDNGTSFQNFKDDFERAAAFQDTQTGTALDTQRAEQAMLNAEQSWEQSKESFRAATDEFKLAIGMPVDEPLTSADLEDIEAIENHINAGTYPLLSPPPAVSDEERALQVALQYRLDLLTFTDRIDDSKRGVEISANAILPDLNINTALSMETDPARYSTTILTYGRANWRSELVFSLPIERTKERNDYRKSIIQVHQAERQQQQQVERIRAEVRRAVHGLILADRSLRIQWRNLEVAKLRLEFAKQQYDDGTIGNRDLVEARNEWTDASNRLNLAKTVRWASILQFRLSTETLRVEDDGTQLPD